MLAVRFRVEGAYLLSGAAAPFRLQETLKRKTWFASLVYVAAYGTCSPYADLANGAGGDTTGGGSASGNTGYICGPIGSTGDNGSGCPYVSCGEPPVCCAAGCSCYGGVCCPYPGAVLPAPSSAVTGCIA